MMISEQITKLRNLLVASDRIVVFTGAGISTESGIPDFRSPNGIWSKMAPIEFQDFVNSEEMRREAWRRKVVIDKDIQQAQPNRGHRAVAKLVESGKCFCVITQNIDGLHQSSGIPPEKIVEIHGNGTYAKCLSCAKRFELSDIYVAFNRDETLPICDSCGGIVKTATISFGQAMPEEEMQRAEYAANNCDLMIAIGSSLVVYPAAGFPIYAKRNGANLVIINREQTEQDQIADLVLNSEIGETLGEALDVD
ncbi:MAG: SIR2 family NAD-dependent protein deacylase [Gammaproteobacteria bacterium]